MSDLQVSVANLRKRLGQRMPVVVDYMPAELAVVATRSAPEPVTGELVLDSIERGVTVTGDLLVKWIGECRRCLDEISGSSEAAVLEIFQIGADPDSDVIPFDGDTVDLEQIVRDAVLVALPLSPLCRDDCAGPDPDRYRPGVDGRRPDHGDADVDGPTRDPRWSGLDQLDLRE